MFVPLHVKSAYSLGAGTASPAKLVERASALGVKAMALTDIDNLYGALVFYRLARARGIHPLIGAEIPIGPGMGRLVLLARNRAGYENLCRIITRRRGLFPQTTEGPGDAEASFDPIADLPAFADGLLVMTDRVEPMERLRATIRSAGPAGALDPSALRFLLVRPAPAGPGGGESGERRVREAAEAWGIPLVADADIEFLDPGDHPLHRLLVAIREKKLVDEVAEPLALGPARHFPGPREWSSRFADLPGAVQEAERIAEICDLDLSRPRPIFPAIPLPPGQTAYSLLAERAFAGLRWRYRSLGSAQLERLTSELSLIERLGFCEYFLVVGDIVRRARERGIEVVGRGSGASSIVAYVLGVTSVDPLEHGLHFERFLHEERPDLPDIDIDLCWIRRDEVIDEVYRTYGTGRVAMISSHITYQPRSAFREAARAFGVPPAEVDRYSKRIPHHLETSLAQAIRDTPLARQIPLGEEPYRSAVPLAERLIGLPNHLSIHPGGIVIGDRPLDCYVPLERAAKGIVITQYDMHSIEDVGLVKIDLLGNRCLTEIQETMERARPSGEGSLPIRLADIPDRDPPTVEVLREGDTLGCFQLESPAMRALLRQLRVESVRDCIVAVALIRPGPSEGGMKDHYLRRRAGEERVEYVCPRLREVLEENYGVILYEEDVMRVAAAVAGMSLAEGDVLRSSLKRAASAEEVREIENAFLSRSIACGVAPDAAALVWKDLLRFCRYAFNKAHAAGYGLLAYQAAYLKVHYPVEFACALFNNRAGMYSLRTIAEDARRRGVPLLAPCVNRSGRRHEVETLPPPDADPAAGAATVGAAALALAAIPAAVPAAAAAPLAAPAPAAAAGAAAPAPAAPQHSAEPRPRSGVRLALDLVKGLSGESIGAILRGRPFRSLGDLLRRTRIPRREIEALILAGALDFTGLNHPQLLWELETTYESECGRGSLGLAQLCCPPSTPCPPPSVPPGGSSRGRGDDWCLPSHPALPAYRPTIRVRQEMETLGLALTAHPLALLRPRAGALGCVPIAEALLARASRVRVAGLVAATRRTPTRSGQTMQFVTLEDETGLLEGTLFPGAYRRLGDRLSNLGPYVVEGDLEERWRAQSLNIRTLERLPDLC